MAIGIFEQLAWLTKTVKRLCCAVEQLQQGGGTQSYKVYTALLTQSGADDAIGITSGNIVVGVTYLINDDFGGADFTNVGAPNNNPGTYFVATGTTPNSWGISGNLIYNPGAPVVTVLENTIGNIWFTYDSVGYYHINANGLFTNNKTFITTQFLLGNDNGYSSGSSMYGLLRVEGDENILRINTLDSPGGGNIDTVLNNTPIEIRVYN